MKDLEKVLKKLLDSDETITFRAVARQIGRAPSSITRSARQRDLVNQFARRQRSLREWSERANRNSRTNLIKKLEEKDQQIEELERKLAVLTASHKAVILAIGEKGGMAAWQRFFKDYQRASADLELIT